MRKYKFRAWDKKNKYMVIIFDSENQEDWFIPAWKDGYVVMQYTGLNDDYDKEIYDGDILYDREDEFYAKVIYMEGAYMVVGNGMVNYLGEEHKNMYIVGNIYEDADKLKDWGLRK